MDDNVHAICKSYYFFQTNDIKTLSKDNQETESNLNLQIGGETQKLISFTKFAHYGERMENFAYGLIITDIYFETAFIHVFPYYKFLYFSCKTGSYRTEIIDLKYCAVSTYVKEEWLV